MPPIRLSRAQLVALAQHLQRPGVVALAFEGEAKIAVGFGEVGPEPDRLAVSGDGLVQLALVPQGVAESVAEFGDHSLRAFARPGPRPPGGAKSPGPAPGKTSLGV